MKGLSLRQRRREKGLFSRRDNQPRQADEEEEEEYEPEEDHEKEIRYAKQRSNLYFPEPAL